MKWLVMITALAGGAIGWLVAGGIPQEVKAVEESVNQAVPVEKLSAIDPAAEVPFAVRSVADGGGSLNFAHVSEFIVNLENASADDCRRWWALMDDADEEMKLMLLRRWAALDPQGALQALGANAEPENFAAAILEGWAGHDLESAVDVALDLDELRLVYAVMRGAGSDGIERLYDLLTERGFDKAAPGFFEAIFSKLAEVDQKKAATLALRFKGGGGFGWQLGLENVLTMWVREDAKSALAWAEGLADSDERERAMQALARKWMAIDPLRALESMGDKIEYSTLRNGGGSMPSGRLDDSDFEKLLSHADALAAENPEDAAFFLRGAVSGLRSGDHPERLAEMASRLGGMDGGEIEWGVAEAAANWARKDEASLVEFINSVDDEPVRAAAIRGLVDWLSRDEPMRALEFLAGLEEPVDGIQTRELIRGALGSGLSPDEVIAQIPEAMRDASLTIFAEGYIGTELNPSDVADFLQRQPAGKERDRAMMFVAGDWAQTAPLAAAAWVAGMEPGKIQEHAAGTVVSTWATIDFEAATEWARGLDDEASRSNALANAAKIATSNDPQRALEIAAEVADDQLRTTWTNHGLIALARQNPSSALEKLSELEVDEEAQQQVRSVAAEALALRAMLGP